MLIECASRNRSLKLLHDTFCNGPPGAIANRSALNIQCWWHTTRSGIQAVVWSAFCHSLCTTSTMASSRRLSQALAVACIFLCVAAAVAHPIDTGNSTTTIWQNAVSLHVHRLSTCSCSCSVAVTSRHCSFIPTALAPVYNA
jgi:hypothetical protein